MGNACGCVDNKEVQGQDEHNYQSPGGLKQVKLDHEVGVSAHQSKPSNDDIHGYDKKVPGGMSTPQKPSALKNPVSGQIGVTAPANVAGNTKQTLTTSNQKPPITEANKASAAKTIESGQKSPAASVTVPSPKNQLVKTSLSHIGQFEEFKQLSEKDKVKKVLTQGVYFEGQEKAGKREGPGRIVHENGPLIEGIFKQDVLEGAGRILKENGDVFLGTFSNNKAQGKGKYMKTGGEVYEGEFKDDKPHGKGSVKYANGNKYEGNFVNGQRNGQGKLHLSNRDVYEGNFVNGQFEGKGRQY